MYPANEHCMVFVGFDESVLAYNSLNMRAVAIVKRVGK